MHTTSYSYVVLFGLTKVIPIACQSKVEDDTIAINGPSSAPFSLPYRNYADDDTILLFKMTPDPIPADATVNCIVTCDENTIQNVAVYMRYSAFFGTSYIPQIGANGQCPVDATVANSSPNFDGVDATGWVYVVNNAFGETVTNAIITCTSSDTLPETDDTLEINGPSSDPFFLGETDGSDFTHQVFKMSPEPIPANAEVSCTLECDSFNEQVYVNMEYGFGFSDLASDGTQVAALATCPVNFSLRNDGDNATGWVNIYTDDGDPLASSTLLEAVLTCTSPDVPSPPTMAPVAVNLPPISDPDSTTPAPVNCGFVGESLWATVRRYMGG